jgi:hypothetical protein
MDNQGPEAKSFTLPRLFRGPLNHALEQARLLDAALDFQNFDAGSIPIFLRDLQDLAVPLHVGVHPALAWRLLQGDERLSSEVRVDCQKRPTLCIAGILARIHGQGGHDVAGLLLQALHYCLVDGVRGHGYDAPGYFCEALGILARGGVVRFLVQNPTFSKKAYEVLCTYTRKLEVDLAPGQPPIRHAFGGDLTPIFRETRRLLSAAMFS